MTSMKNLRRGAALAAAVAMTAAQALVVGPAVADTAPPESLPPTVSGDVLPAPQINGVVWDQEVAAGLVFAGGKFTAGRPFGAAKGENEVARSNILAYKLSDGKMTGFAPKVNGEIKSITATKDGKRVYVAGQFTAIDGKKRYRLAAFDTGSGKLVESFVPTVDFRVNAVAVAGDTVYAGGAFGSVGGNARQGLAAFDANTGELLDWTANATGGQVNGLVVSPDNNKLVAVGQFSAVNGQRARGWAAIDTSSGEVLPWKGNQWLQTSGQKAGIYSVSSDNNNVYIAAYSHGGGAFEGVAAANWADGGMTWLMDCHGDSYDTAAAGNVLYYVSHVHNCEVVGHKPETKPWTYMRANALTIGRSPKGTVNRSRDFNGAPAAEFLHWYPDLAAGTFTGQNQAAWTVEAADGYVLLGGEFPRINGVKQQGLARFGVRDKAPNEYGPMTPEGEVEVNIGRAGGGVQARVQTIWDVDNEYLTYSLLHNGKVVDKKQVASNFFTLPQLTLTHEGGTGEGEYSVVVVDPLGNSTSGEVPDGGGPDPVEPPDGGGGDGDDEGDAGDDEDVIDDDDEVVGEPGGPNKPPGQGGRPPRGGNLLANLFGPLGDFFKNTLGGWFRNPFGMFRM